MQLCRLVRAITTYCDKIIRYFASNVSFSNPMKTKIFPLPKLKSCLLNLCQRRRPLGLIYYLEMICVLSCRCVPVTHGIRWYILITTQLPELLNTKYYVWWGLMYHCHFLYHYPKYTLSLIQYPVIWFSARSREAIRLVVRMIRPPWNLTTITVTLSSFIYVIVLLSIFQSRTFETFEILWRDFTSDIETLPSLQFHGYHTEFSISYLLVLIISAYNTHIYIHIHRYISNKYISYIGQQVNLIFEKDWQDIECGIRDLHHKKCVSQKMRNLIAVWRKCQSFLK